MSVVTSPIILAFFLFILLTQRRPQGLLLVQNGGRRNPWSRLLKYFKNRGVFCHVKHDEMAFAEIVSSVWPPCLFSANGNCCSNETKTGKKIITTCANKLHGNHLNPREKAEHG